MNSFRCRRSMRESLGRAGIRVRRGCGVVMVLRVRSCGQLIIWYGAPRQKIGVQLQVHRDARHGHAGVGVRRLGVLMGTSLACSHGNEMIHRRICEYHGHLNELQHLFRLAHLIVISSRQDLSTHTHQRTSPPPAIPQFISPPLGIFRLRRGGRLFRRGGGRRARGWRGHLVRGWW